MNDRRIVIVGFMGCGKTTVAGALAQRLGCAMVDLDSFITDREGRSPAEIIKQEGEPAFRAIETRALQDVLGNSAARVIALGGGAWTIPTNRALAEKHDCLSVWLDAPFELCWQRITSGRTTRPLAPDREGAEALYASRRPAYGQAQIRIDSPEIKGLDGLVMEIETYIE
jgi:shikimate kinase